MLYPSDTWLGGLAPILGFLVVALAAIIFVIAAGLFVFVSVRHMSHLRKVGLSEITIKAGLMNILESGVITLLIFFIALSPAILILTVIVYVPAVGAVCLVLFVASILVSVRRFTTRRAKRTSGE